MLSSFEESDTIIKYFKDADAGYFSVTSEQSFKIKSIWNLLHIYDADHEYTFNDDFTMLRKDKRSDWYKKRA
jgi:hypothetical protein